MIRQHCRFYYNKDFKNKKNIVHTYRKVGTILQKKIHVAWIFIMICTFPENDVLCNNMI